MKQTATEITKKVLFLMVGLLCAFGVQAQTIAVSGTVTDPEGEPLIGASVLAEGSSVGTATDIDGNYSLNVPSNAVLVVSYVGYDTQKVPVNGRTHIDVQLSENSVMLNEVVAIGYGTVKKADATGSVSVIKPDEIEAGLASSAQDMLVGAAPGVVVTTSGAPQGGANIVIRGGASLAASNEPLIVIDGVPMDRSSVTGSSNPLSLVSPENIESMTILKDASATAIYGSRASNGVIIITTKKGQSGRPQVNFSANVYVNTPRNMLDMMSGAEFADFIRTTYGDDSKQAQALYGYDTNWQKEVLRTSVSSDYNLSIGGTAGVLPYRVALSYTNNNGIIKHSKMDRATVGVNLTPKFFNDLLSVNVNLKGAYITNGYTQSVLNGAISYNPTLPLKNPEGNVFNNWTTYTSGTELAGPNTPGTAINTIAGLNPISLLEDYSSKSKVYQSVGNLQLDLKMPFLTDLRANLNLGYDYSHGECTNYNFPFSPQAWKSGYRNPQDVDVKNGYTNRSKENQEKYNLLLDFFLNYNKDFAAINSSLDLTAGYSWQKFITRSHNFSQVYIPEKNEYNEAYFDTDNGYQASPTYYYSAPFQLLSFFGRLNYSFMDRYLLTVTVRRDGTSRFSKDHRWGTFPAVALGWKLLDESFMEGARGVMSELKLRAGYGVTGQQDLMSDYFPYMPIYSISTSISERYPNPNGNGQTIALVTPNAYNSDLKWEETTTWNAGIDFGFLNGRISGSIEYYKRKTKDLLTYANYIAGSNLTNMGNMNLGDLENEGVEFNIATRPIVTRDFTWSSSLNVAWNHNKITRLADGADTTTGGIGNGVNIQKHEVGHTAFSFYVYEQVYGADGNPLEGVFVDRNGDGVLTDADKYLYHSRDPKVTMTWNNNFNYKNWDLGFVLRANIGNWMYNATMKDNCFVSATSTPPLSNILDNTYLFTSTRTTELLCSDYFVQNASFLRCDNITLGYTWPDLLNDNLRLRLYGAVQNPFVITKYKGLDPEVFSGIDSDVYPRPVTVSVGVVATF